MDTTEYLNNIQRALDTSIAIARENNDGELASYIPELAKVDPSYLSCSAMLVDGSTMLSGDDPSHKVTLQSVSKLIVLIGLMEEFGPEKVLSWVNVEPSGQSFSSLLALEQLGPIPSNPLINAGAIALCDKIPGADRQAKIAWLRKWLERIFGKALTFSETVFQSELISGDRNRSLAHLMKSNGVLTQDVDDVLVPYFSLCSYEVDIETVVRLPMLLANGGETSEGNYVFSEEVSNIVVSIMATCGLYDESGNFLVRTGMPAKTSVSGLIVAVATGRGGIAVVSPKLNSKGTSVRGDIVIENISRALDWHFAAPWRYSSN